RVELGALLWLLSLPAEHFLRLGGGKPLGFGSVRLELASATLHDGNGWQQFYGTLDSCSPPLVVPQEVIREFQAAVGSAYGNGAPFEQVPSRAPFRRGPTVLAAGCPPHSPRARQEGQEFAAPPHPEGQAYEWFVANDRTGAQGGPRVSLPALATD